MIGLLEAAHGNSPVDLPLTNPQLVKVHSREIYPADVAIHHGGVVGIGDYRAGPVIDLGGASWPRVSRTRTCTWSRLW